MKIKGSRENPHNPKGILEKYEDGSILLGKKYGKITSRILPDF
jgi:hypothetical protein